MKSRESPLTKELLALYLKYGAKEFEVAARELRTGDFSRLIAQAVDSLGAAAPRSKSGIKRSDPTERTPTPRRSKQEILIDYIDNLMKTGSSADAEIAKFAERIMRRNVFATSRSLHDYMAIIGVKSDVKTGDRYQYIKRIAEFLRALPKEEVTERIRSAEGLGEGGSDLQRWADIIVKPQGR
jgi:hypothetical protein